MEKIVKIQRLKLGDQVYKFLKQRIANHRFVLGCHLNIEELTRDLGVSRTPVWEAIRRLEREGLVRNEPKRGVMVVELTPKAAIELYTVREVLECLAIRFSVDRMDEKTLKRMAQSLKKQKKVIGQRDLVAYSQLDFEFHGFIYEKCDNALLQEMLETIKERARPINMLITPILSDLYHDHVLILEALECRNKEKAEEAISRHNRLLLEKIKKDVSSGNWLTLKSLQRVTTSPHKKGILRK